MTAALAHSSTVLWIADWPGREPEIGDFIEGAGGRTFYRLRQLAHDGPLLGLHVSRHSKPQPGAAVHPWPEQQAPAPRPRQTAEQRSASAAYQARLMRLAAEAAPPAKADGSVWDDPEDRLTTRQPKQIKGHRRGDVLGRLHRRGSSYVTREHVLAGQQFATAWDLAHIGPSHGAALAERVGGGMAGPRAGPGLEATQRAAAERDVARTLRAIGPAAVPLLIWTVIDSRDVAAWCAARIDPRTGKKPCAKVQMGRLLGVLDRLAEALGLAQDRSSAIS